MKNFEVEENLSSGRLKLKKFEVGENWNSRNVKFEKFVVEEVWGWRSLMLKFGALFPFLGFRVIFGGSG